MNTQLKAHLEAAIKKWAEDNCDDEDIWPQGIVGNQTILLMAGAAASVFDAVMEVQEYGKREGVFEESPAKLDTWKTQA